MEKRIFISSIGLILLLASLLASTSQLQSVQAVEYTDVTVAEARSMMDSLPFLVVLDVRTQSEYDSGHIRNAKLIPVTELPGRLGELNQTDDILVYCGSGGRSRTASQILVDNGFLHVYNMLGGIAAWTSEGYVVYIRYSSIQQAINDAAEGDALLVSSGTYVENVVVNKSISLIGEEMSNTIINGNYTDNAMTVTANNVTISHFTIINGVADGAPRSGIELYDVEHCIVSNNSLANNTCGISLSASSSNKLYHNNFINNTVHVLPTSSLAVNIWDDGYPFGGNYWSNYTGIDSFLGPAQNLVGSDGIGDTPHLVYEDNQDNYPLMRPFVSGNLTVHIYTDKYSYHAGETVHLGLEITNPDSVKYLCFALWCRLPDGSAYVVMHQHSTILPIGLVYNNAVFKTFSLPDIPVGTYTWHVALLVRASHLALANDMAEWMFS
ncbi:MAG: right-handed parallel beta-helix repeat-containing protein [Candidatus Bathyarchaeota archaeon]|nr:MAG: right-handed parallel beta-helix repeat-containing protein [Candidatus Bathyarchaeota archaeon]